MGARRRAARGEIAFGTVDTWLLWQLTGGRVHATDASNASRTLLLDLHTGDWDDALLRLLRIPREILPEVRASSEIHGEVSAVPALRAMAANKCSRHMGIPLSMLATGTIFSRDKKNDVSIIFVWALAVGSNCQMPWSELELYMK